MISLGTSRDHIRVASTLDRLTSQADHEHAVSIFEAYMNAHTIASRAKKKGVDLDENPQSQEVCDIGDRLEMEIGLKGISDQVRTYPSNLSPQEVAFRVSDDIALGRFGFFGQEETLNYAVAAGLSCVMSCVSIAHAKDITNAVIKKNGDGTSYAALVYGQIKELTSPLQAAFLLLLLDKVRLRVGLDKYHPGSMGEDDVGRYIEEYGLYHRETKPSGAAVLESDIRLVLQSIPVEIDGLGTEEFEVQLNRDFKRIQGNKVRGGALYVLVGGVISKAPRLLEFAKKFQIPEWEWLSGVKGYTSAEPEDPRSYVLDAKPGKPVLSLPNVPGGFALRYGRAENTGFGTYGFNPFLLDLLDSPLASGTQLKVTLAGRTGSTGAVDSLRPPLVRLRNGEVKQISDAEAARSAKDQLDTILDLGDILVSPNEFSHPSHGLEPSGYVEEWWSSDLRRAIEERHLDIEQLSTLSSIAADRLEQFSITHGHAFPSFSEALKLSESLGIPLHPRFVFSWDLLNIREIFSLREAAIDFKADPSGSTSSSFQNSVQVKQSLEIARIPHKVIGSAIVLEGEVAAIVNHTLAPDRVIPINIAYPDTLSLLKFLSGVDIRKRSSTFVGVAMRKAEITGPRKMRPSIHSIFPVGTKNPSRDLLQASRTPSIVEMEMRSCPSCGARSPYELCPFCESKTNQIFFCPKCKKECSTPQCPECSSLATQIQSTVPRVSDLLRAASETVSLQPYPPLRGVVKLTSLQRIPERLEKGILRQRHNLTCFKDGTIRYDAVNAPLTHFKPSQFHMDIQTLHNLGYSTDKFGKPLESADQIVNLKLQDVILPQDSGDHFKRLSEFIDDLLTRFFKVEAFYEAQKPAGLIGALIVGISPKGSLGTVGRIIGFTEGHVCFAHPLWHATKNRDCGGDVDSLTLLMDVFLNFSPRICPDQATGLIDTPTMLQPLTYPLNKDARSSILDTYDNYPSGFYEATLSRPSLNTLEENLFSGSGSGRPENLSYTYTHWTMLVTTTHPQSSYSIPGPMPDKVNKQIAVASRIQAVDVDSLVSSLLNNYLVKEILDNLDTYTTQKFQCKGCGETYRRPPLKGVCLTCGRELLPSLTLSAVETYILLASELIRTHNLPQPIKDKVTLTVENLQLLSESKKQMTIADFT